VYLEAYTLRIEDVYIRTELAEDHSSAEVSIEVKATPRAAEPANVQIRVVDSGGAEVYSTSTELTDTGEGTVKLSVQSPQLWWSYGLGHQHLYTAHVTLADSRSQNLDSSSTRFGIRSIELIQRPLDDHPGKTFMFRLNGVDIFSQGVNWIPADNLLPTITRQRYFDWIRTVTFANMNMIRVWGGGIYETADFFDACDELGVLVWHDYAFACGDYPLHDEFVDSLKKEAEIQTIRMRNRASLALLCGGNEDFLMYDWLK
jgi:beta-mannosidase